LLMMLQLPGSAALSGFRLDKLLLRLRQSEPRVRQLSARYQHFVDLSEPLGTERRRLLERLLDDGGEAQPVSAATTAHHELVVLPRLGTVSPWSSKATDIVHVCGISEVRRVERGTLYRLGVDAALGEDELLRLGALLHDRMTETVHADLQSAEQLFTRPSAAPLSTIPIRRDGRTALEAADRRLSLALSREEMEYLLEAYARYGRDPTDVELMMFAQANSEHCRHKIFNAQFSVDGVAQPLSLFGMIKNTYARSPAGVLSAYKDNAAVIAGPIGQRFFADPLSRRYGYHQEPIDILAKVETHNHPTAISPFPGASTGAGGEIRDEGATGRGAKPKAGLTGFSVSNLHIPEFAQPWEAPPARSPRISSALDIMLDGPIGACAFNNEFGRPGILGYFRTFEQRVAGDPPGVTRGYHKPIMLAGGLGNIRRAQVDKGEVPAGANLVVLGGPALLIGLGGGAASSLGSGASSLDLDFASVQRGNPEMQRRAQEVIDRCWALGGDNPIRLIHDVGAGGSPTRCPRPWRTAGGAALSNCARCRPTKPACRHLSCGAMRRRNATYCASTTTDSSDSRSSARASAARMRSSGVPPATGVWSLPIAPSATGRWICRSTCCWACHRA